MLLPVVYVFWEKKLNLRQPNKLKTQIATIKSHCFEQKLIHFQYIFWLHIKSNNVTPRTTIIPINYSMFWRKQQQINKIIKRKKKYSFYLINPLNSKNIKTCIINKLFTSPYPETCSKFLDSGAFSLCECKLRFVLEWTKIHHYK